MARVVRPETVKLSLASGDVLVVKKRLNVGEQRGYFARLYIAGADGALRANPLAVGIETVITYLVDWTLTDEEGGLLPSIRGEDHDVVMGLLDSLDPETFAEIKEAVEAHIEKETKARAEEKNDRDGRSTSAATSPSPVAANGASSGSVN